jgi:hypothetical protein
MRRIRGARQRRRCDSAFSRHDLPGFCEPSRSRNRRAQGMPGAWCTRGLVCSEKSTRVRNRGHAEQSGIPCTMGYGLSRALPGVRALIATVASEITRWLDPSIGGSGPHAFAVRRDHASPCTTRRPSHPEPNVRGDAYAPPVGRMGRNLHLILSSDKQKYFQLKGLA